MTNKDNVDGRDILYVTKYFSTNVQTVALKTK